MFQKFIVDFAEYLNQNDYAISAEKVTRLFGMLEEDIDITDEDILISLLRSAFCTDYNQYISLPDHFHAFIANKNKITQSNEAKKEIEKLRERRQALSDEHAASKQTAKEKAENARKKRMQEEKRVRDEIENEEKNRLTPELTSGEKKNISGIKKEIEDLHNEILNSVLIREDFTSITQDDLIQAEKDLVKQARQELLKGNMSAIKTIKTIQQIIHKLIQFYQNSETELQKRVRARENEVQQKIKDFLKAEKEADDAYQDELMKQIKVQQELNTRLKELQNQIVDELEIKTQSVTHRDVFIGRKATQTILDAPEFIDSKFDKLTQKQKIQIRNYLLTNLLKFKTKLTSNIATLEKNQIDMQETIQYACKTGGLPMEIHYKKKRPSKANLLLVLDVSGSCKEASFMMLTFMYYLQSIFPRGCKAYAFVNSLYDISEMLNADDPDKAIDAALKTIPRNGVYSNYCVPMHQIWEDHKTEITDNTIVIFMGDARNNKNDPAYNEVKNICRKAKKAYWLNTEPIDKWGRQDSIATEYSRYAKMYETTTVRDIIWFINEGIK